MSTDTTRQVLEEVRSILAASNLEPVATINQLKPLAEMTVDVAVDVSLESVVFILDSNSAGRGAYQRTFMLHLHVGVNCSEDVLALMDVVDNMEANLLHDSKLWNIITDRDIVSVVYDHGETLPYRGATILMEVRTRMDDCS